MPCHADHYVAEKRLILEAMTRITCVYLHQEYVPIDAKVQDNDKTSSQSTQASCKLS